MGIICAFLIVYMIVMGARAVLSWFPARPGTAMASVNAILRDVTEPVLAPVRRVIPPIGMIDISFMVVFFVLYLLLQILCG